jgi:SAM-dependent methyltransferase
MDVKPNYAPEIQLTEAGLDSLHDLFTRRETMDASMHERMIDLIRPIIATFQDAHWLTVGDEGGDAWMLRQRGVAAVTASSISDARLQRAAELGHLAGVPVRALNAEQLDCPDGAFDFVLCNQAYHHVRRAPLAFYEFMRVARVGFVLIEPVEYRSRPFEIIRTFAKMMLRRRPPVFDIFEPSGNYIYRLSERDVFRMLTALQAQWFAIKTFNNFYLGWLAGRRRDSVLARAIFRLGIGLQDFLCFFRLMGPGMCAVFVPTATDADSLRAALRAAHFRIVTIPRNPYNLDQQAAAERV